MSILKSGTIVLCASLLFCTLHALDNGLGLTPPMGWLSWERYACQLDCKLFPDDCIGERLYMRMADALVNFGYRDVGYEYVNIDDCWNTDRGPSNELVADPSRFPSGIRALAAYVHARGLKLGIYLDIGTATCCGLPAFNVPWKANDTNTQYISDVNQLASWGIDSLKVDGCNADPTTMNITYPKLSKALNATGRPILYACSWPDYMRGAGLPIPYDLMAENCNLWRNYDDITDSYSSIYGIMSYWKDKSPELTKVAQPGAFNDPDMLMIGGTGLSLHQEEMQMAMWAIFAGPLLMSNDLYSVTNASRAILQNTEVIAVNQDRLGQAGTLIRTIMSPKKGKPRHAQLEDDNQQIWKRPLANGDWAVALLNKASFGPPSMLFFNATDLPTSKQFTVRDLFRKVDLGTFTDTFSVSVTTSSVVFVRVSPTADQA